MGDESFADAYGTNHNKRNAFGKCVSKCAQSMDKEEEKEADECEAADRVESTEEDEGATLASAIEDGGAAEEEGSGSCEAAEDGGASRECDEA